MRLQPRLFNTEQTRLKPRLPGARDDLPDEGNAGTAVDQWKNRVVYVVAAHFDPLIDPSDSHRLQAIEALG